MLRELWTKLALPQQVLEKHFTEIQVAENPEGKIIAAIGLKIERLHGHIHSEAISDPNDSNLYEAFWQRLQILGRNHGLFRMWTESSNPYWKTVGFSAPDAKALEKMPAGFSLKKEAVLTHAIREESAEGLSVEQQFEMFTQAQKMETERLLQQAQVFKRVAYVIILIISGGLIFYALMRFLNRGTRRRRE